MSETASEIEQLLRQVQAAEPVVREFAWVWLDAYRRDTQAILEQHRRAGRARAGQGEDPSPVQKQTEERLTEARRSLRDRLARLIAWAKESGRLRP